MLNAIVLPGFVVALSIGPILAKAEAVPRATAVEESVVVDTENWFMQASRRFVAEQVDPSRRRAVVGVAGDQGPRR